MFENMGRLLPKMDTLGAIFCKDTPTKMGCSSKLSIPNYF
jgi:hypothetical protein